MRGFTTWLALLASTLLILCGDLDAAWGRGGPQEPATVTAREKPTKKVEVHLWVSRDIAPSRNIRLSLNTCNANTVRLAAYRIDGVAYILGRDENPKVGISGSDGKSSGSWVVSMVEPPKLRALAAAPAPVQADVYRSRQINLPPLPPGVYRLVMSAAGKEARSVVNVTDLAIVLKRGPRNLLAWVTDHRSGNPIAGALVELWGHKPLRLVTRGVTAADGTYYFGAQPQPNQTLLIQRPNVKQPDIAGMPTAAENPDGQLVGHLQTDRPVYRPGAHVQFRAILRRTSGRAYTAESNRGYTIEFRDPRDNVLQRKTMSTSAIGTLADTFDVAPSAALGAYSLVITPTHGEGSLYQTFTVAEYRKPEFQVTLSPGKTRYLAGQKASFGIKATYYFGAPLPHAQVKYRIRRSLNPFVGGTFGDETDQALWFSGGDGNLYARDMYSSQPFVGEGTLETDDKGRATVPVDTGVELPDSIYSVTCTVTDGQRRQVEASESVPVYAAAVRVGISARLLCVPIGAVVPVDLRLADLDGKPVAGRMALRTQRQEWDVKANDFRTVVLSRTTVAAGSNGKAVGNVPMLHQGDVEIVAEMKDGTGRTARASTDVYVAGMHADRAEREQHQGPFVTIKLARRIYHPGDSVEVYASTNTPGRPMLLAVEGGSVFKYVVTPRRASSFHWTIQATAEMSPNGFVTAAQWAMPAQLVTASAQMPVPDLTRRLSVTIEPGGSSFRPGETVHYRIHVADGLTGGPVAGAETAFAVVDESIYAVHPDTTADPYETYWGLRPNLVESSSSAPEEVSGGAYQRNNPNGVATVRERFLDTAAWEAHAVTGADGNANVDVQLPGNLTSWRAIAVAITGSTRAGWARSNVTVSRPVMLRLSTPRQFVQGDSITLIGTINNRTDRRLTFDVDIDTIGVALPSGEPGSKKIEVPAGAEGKVEWRLIAPTLPDNPDLAATIEGRLVARGLAPSEKVADFSDRIRLQIPVRPHGVAQHGALGGLLEPGDAVQTMHFSLPDDRIEPATSITVSVGNGVAQSAISAARDVLTGGWQNVADAAARLRILATPGAPAGGLEATRVRDDLAALARYQRPDGAWGLWNSGPPDPGATANALLALVALNAQPAQLPSTMPFPDKLFRAGIAGAQSVYEQGGLWEDRARLAVALAAADPKKIELVREVIRRGGDGLSPDALLLLADASQRLGDREAAVRLVQRVLPIAVVGPTFANIPRGDHPGWQRGQSETSAQALLTLLHLHQAPELQAKLARTLADPDGGDDYLALDARATVAQALLEYASAHGGLHVDPIRADQVSIEINGTAVPWTVRLPGTEGFAPLAVNVPRSLLRNGDNAVVVRRIGTKAAEWFASVVSSVCVPSPNETGDDMRVLRRFEMQTAFGTWRTIQPGGIVVPSRPVRVTVVVWPNDTADAVAVSEPMPCGFAFADSELPDYAVEEVRDGAVLHYLMANGSAPLTFVYYIRAETDGSVTALPATAYLVRRPDIHAGSAEQRLTVHAEVKK